MYTTVCPRGGVYPTKDNCDESNDICIQSWLTLSSVPLRSTESGSVTVSPGDPDWIARCSAADAKPEPSTPSEDFQTPPEVSNANKTVLSEQLCTMARRAS